MVLSFVDLNKIIFFYNKSLIHGLASCCVIGVKLFFFRVFFGS